MRGNIDERGKKLFIGGLHLKTTEESLKAFYGQWGEIIDVVVMRDPHSGKSRGFGFVTYSDSSAVDEAQSNRPHEIDGIKVDAKRAMPKEDTSPEFHATVNRLFVGRLKKTATVEELKTYFSQYGVISDAVIINSPTGESRGFGFVTFEDPDSVDKIIVSRPHEIDGQALEVKKALPRGEDNKGGSNRGPQGGAQGGNRRGGNFNNSNNNRGSYNSNMTPRGGYNSNTGPRGGYSNNNNSSYNQRFEEDNNDNSFGNYTSPANNYRAPYNPNVPYSQNYNSVPTTPYQQNYTANPNQQYAQNYNSVPNKAPLNNPTYSDQQFDQSFGQQPVYETEADFNNFNQFNAPAVPPSRPYGYPPYGGGRGGGAAGAMGDYSNQKPAAGPIRGGSAAGFGRGGPRYGSVPY